MSSRNSKTCLTYTVSLNLRVVTTYITLFNRVTRLSEAENMSYKMLKFHFMDACRNIFNLIKLGEALSMNVIRMERPIAAQ